MCIDPEIVMNRRAEIWLEDADELGFLMLTLGEFPLLDLMIKETGADYIDLLVNATERNIPNISSE